MIDRTTKLRWRRKLRRSKQQVEDFGNNTEDHLEKHFFNRLSRLTKVRRFMAAWSLLFILLIGLVLHQTRALGQYYLTSAPAAGGVMSEGVLGTFGNANPIYASGNVDSSVERLMFSGLFKLNANNKLTPDLAQSYLLDERGTTYTVKLKDNLVWQDGVALTAKDVAFTYHTIQTPDAKSPLITSWQGIKVSAPNDTTIVFTLPSILSAFPYSMTNGIIPEHLLGKVPASQLRSVSFNSTAPVGSGPFRWEALEVSTNNDIKEQRISFVPNAVYHGGMPNIERYIIRTFSDEQELTSAFENREITAAAGLSRISDTIANDDSAQTYKIPLTTQVMVFFKTSSPVLADVNVRRALSNGVNIKELIRGLGRPVLPANGPLIRNQVGYDPALTQQTGNLEAAKKQLDDAGWKMGSKGYRQKDKQPLSFMLTTQRNSTYDYLARALQDQWAELGVKVQIVALEDTQLQEALSVHNYDALLYGISLGADPDVFAFWHSSQADLSSPTRLNFSEYRSPVADKALEGGRTRSEDVVRAVKYRPFLDAWRQDVPAIALYQPRYVYAVREPLFGFDATIMNLGADRLNNVANWKVRVSDQPAP